MLSCQHGVLCLQERCWLRSADDPLVSQWQVQAARGCHQFLLCHFFPPSIVFRSEWQLLPLPESRSPASATLYYSVDTRAAGLYERVEQLHSAQSTARGASDEHFSILEQRLARLEAARLQAASQPHHIAAGAGPPRNAPGCLVELSSDTCQNYCCNVMTWICLGYDTGAVTNGVLPPHPRVLPANAEIAFPLCVSDPSFSAVLSPVVWHVQ